MSRILHYRIWLIVVLVGIALLALPLSAAAANQADDIVLVDQPVQPTFALPGLFSLTLSAGANGALAPTIDLPSLNATAAVNGLNLSNGVSFDNVTVSQKSPATSPAYTISGVQAVVSGPALNYSSIFTGHLEVHPNSNVQATGTVAGVYDGVNKRLGIAVQDGNAVVTAGPVNVAVTGVNTLANAIKVDTVTVSAPASNSSIVLDGYSVVNGKTDWNALTVSQPQIMLGNLGSVTGLKVTIGGPSSGYTSDATAQYTFNLGQLYSTQGQVTASHNGATQQTSFAIKDASSSVNLPGWKFTTTGVNFANGTYSVDSVKFGSEVINLQGEFTNVTFSPGAAPTFDKAQIRYIPTQQPGTQSAFGGIEFTITRTDGGYVVGTNTLLTSATAK
jgi:hypothetical protein